MNIPKGKIIPIGGNEAKKPQDKLSEDQDQIPDFFKSGILKEVMNEIKKEHPVIEILPIASGSPQDMGKKYQDAFHNLGIDVKVLTFSNIKEADLEENIERILKADAVFFTGGDQDVLVKAIAGTKLLGIIKGKYYNEDFVIAGTSAGAMAMAGIMINSGKSDEALLKGVIEMKNGLEFLPDVIIDTHFLSRGRLSRLTEAVLQKKDFIGLGFCEDTGAVISEGVNLRAIGSGTITIIDGKGIKNSNYEKTGKHEPVFVENLKIHFLARGAAFSLKKRQFIPVS